MKRVVAALLLAGLSLLAAVRAQDSVCHPTADEVRAGFLPTAGACVPPAPDPEEEPKMRGEGAALPIQDRALGGSRVFAKEQH